MGMQSRLGGWSRSWVVVTIIWIVTMLSASLSSMPTRADYAPAATTTEVAQTGEPEWSKAPVVADDVAAAPNWFDQFDAAPPVSEAQYRNDVLAFWMLRAPLLLIPPALAALAMLASRWIWRGFARK